MAPRPAPAWQTTEWFNTEEPLTLERLHGKVVLLHAFQMLCPGCVEHGIPQAQRVARTFAGAPLVVVGMHTVFEHHEAMRAPSLKAFLHEYRVAFPVGIDAPDPEGGFIPQTMKAYAMRGTPTTILIDAQGRMRRHAFGVHEDLMLGAELQTLLIEAQSQVRGTERGWVQPEATLVAAGCDERGCALPARDDSSH